MSNFVDTVIRISHDNKEWEILDKTKDEFEVIRCEIRYLSTEEEFEGTITSISTNGTYTILITKRTVEQKKNRPNHI